jgi:hypothetical protein
LGQEPANYISGDKLDSFVRDYSRARLEDKEFCDSIKMIDEIVGQALGLLV